VFAGDMEFSARAYVCLLVLLACLFERGFFFWVSVAYIFR
jgi:hypothetical protein